MYFQQTISILNQVSCDHLQKLQLSGRHSSTPTPPPTPPGSRPPTPPGSRGPCPRRPSAPPAPSSPLASSCTPVC